MGEAPAFFADTLQNGSSNWDIEKSVTIGDKSYAICGTDDENTSSLGVWVYEKHANDWVTPVVLGTKPKTCKGHSAVLLNEDRILVVCKGLTTDDCIWFLEVDTPYVREQKELLGTEVVAWSKVVKGSAKKPIVISGPSGVGKGTLISMLMKEFPVTFGFSVSHTTRAPRGMEKDGVHYHFTQKSVMENDIKDGKFLEFASVHGNLYGTSIEAVEVVADCGKRCILDIDVQGARSVKASSIDATFIFICPPSMNELEDRLRARGTETEEQIQKRLKNAEAEIIQGKTSGIFDHILYNDNLEDCYKSLKLLLGLDGNSPVNHVTFSEGVDLPEEHTVSKMEDKILILQLGKTPKNSVVLDVSSLNGGAPGRTRGLVVNAIDASSNHSNGFNEFS